MVSVDAVTAAQSNADEELVRHVCSSPVRLIVLGADSKARALLVNQARQLVSGIISKREMRDYINGTLFCLKMHYYTML